MQLDYPNEWNKMKLSVALESLLVALIFAVSPASSADDPKEAYFNGTSYLRLVNPMPIWGHSAMSLRTCLGGEFLLQRYNRHMLVMSVNSNALTVSLLTPTVKVEANVPCKLLDNKWHTIQFLYQLGNLNLIVDKQSTVIANGTYNSIFLTDTEIKNEAAVLLLGTSYSGCILHGPGLIFNTSGMNSQSVVFGPCPLRPGSCDQRDVLIRLPVDHCLHDPCMQHGSCISRADSYECHCTSRYSGKNCEIEAGPPCASDPCKNGGGCSEDSRGNFHCTCAAGFTGSLCETEISIHPLCENNPCQNNGTCRVSPNTNRLECECLPGFTGLRCETNFNDCESQPCLNDGECIDEVGGFKCNCTGTGYSGTMCQINIDECMISSPCLNGGVCFDTYGSYTCECQPGFGGNNCEQQVNECLSLPCGNGTCIDLKGGRYNCICPVGYSGENCEIGPPCPRECPPDTECIAGQCVCLSDSDGNCFSTPTPKSAQSTSCNCLNGGTCAGTTSNFSCICPRGYTGTLCETDIDECNITTGICGHGICVNQPGSFKCYCEPGFTGLLCDVDVDECLSHPCKNEATCLNKINDYQCVCPPGFSGKDCSHDIDECASNPCFKGSTCIDQVASFTCMCIPGMTGPRCDIDIDDCESQPCQNKGQCKDELGGFTCNCTGTGFTGNNCEVNIDECITVPCENGAVCVDLVNDYECRCYEGYEGKNCERDIDECESTPCQYNGKCLERSNRILYTLPERFTSLPPIFSQPFSYENASGYECICVPGIIGKNCEINVNECESDPCKHGSCVDGVGMFTCDCDDGYEGEICETEIDECERYHPCIHGKCHDKIGYYLCKCDALWGGKNCSVELIGCLDEPCRNGGQCSPSLENETIHNFNCTCVDGYQGDRCEQETTLSLAANSLVIVNTSRSEGYDIYLRFKTTLPNGILVFGSGQNSYILELVNGRLNLHSSLLNKWEGVFIGSGLNNSRWHKVFVAINSTHLLLSANEETTIYPINSYDSALSNVSYTSFPVTYLGGTIPHLRSYLQHLTHAPSSFVGCMQDVVINGQWIFPHEINENQNLTNIEAGCPRQEQCQPNPCHSNGQCIDLWHTFSCACPRPHLGHTCQYNITAATFGHENTTHSTVVVNVDDVAQRTVRSVFDISMFIKTRQPTGQVFYLGSNPKKSNLSQSFVSAKLNGGELLVKIQFNGAPEEQPVGGNRLDNGFTHLLQVVRNHTLVQVKINGTEYFRKTLSSLGQLDADVLYLGGPPPTVDGSELALSEDDLKKIYFKGIIQDVQVSNGSFPMSVELFPINEPDIVLPMSFGEVLLDETSILRGEVSDDLCRKAPCGHGAVCKNTWNDFVCICPRGYKGKYCQDIQFCELNQCPGESVCQNLDDGYECLTNMTFQGNEISPLSFIFHQKDDNASVVRKEVQVEVSYRTKTGGTMFYVQEGEMYFEIAVYKDQVTVQWRLSEKELPETRRFHNENSNFGWETIYIRVLDEMIEGGFKGWEDGIDPQPLFIAPVDQMMFTDLLSGKYAIYLGGMPQIESNHITKGINNGAVFKGCLGEVRVNGFLLPYFTQSEVYPETLPPRPHFRLNSSKPEEGCILCFQQDCQNGGICNSPSDNYACQCPDGYESDDCSHNTDECLTAKCTNNSTCIDLIAKYTCQCLPGYTGEYCESEINECESNPCHNGGQCTDLLAAYSCACTDDYAGPQCDILKQVTCDNGPCRSGALCVDGFNATTGNNFTCTCESGYQGALCDEPFCKNEPCQNGGFCLTTDDTPTCKCSFGYTGIHCETDINECESNPCQNGGSCVDSIGHYKCQCHGTGFEGVNCENDIDECVVSQIKCGDKGYCVNTPGSFRCNCDEGLCGPECKLENPCISNQVCMNDGVCIENCDEEPDYICNCTSEYMGKNCTLMASLRDDEGITPTDIAIIVVPIVVGILIIGGILMGAFLMMARNKRATRGTYSPSAQEYCNPRLEMDNVLKPPPEERLI